MIKTTLAARPNNNTDTIVDEKKTSSLQQATSQVQKAAEPIKEEACRQEQPNINASNGVKFKTVQYLLNGISKYLTSDSKPANIQRQELQASQENEQISSKPKTKANADFFKMADTEPTDMNKDRPVRQRIFSEQQDSNAVKYSINCDTKSEPDLIEDYASDDELHIGERQSSTNSKTSLDGTNSQSEGQNSQSFKMVEKSAQELSTVLASFLSDQFESADGKILVESVYQDLVCDEEKLFQQIVCQASVDQTKMVAFLDDLDFKKFSKATLFNIVNTAEDVSPACQSIIFILERDLNKDNYSQMKETMDVIDAKRLTKSTIKDFVKPTELVQTLEKYGFFQLEI